MFGLGFGELLILLVILISVLSVLAIGLFIRALFRRLPPPRP
jgi:hypothetical protein